MEQYEVWYQDGRTRKMRVVYTMANSCKEARQNLAQIISSKPVDCRKRIIPSVTRRTLWWLKNAMS